MPDLSWRQPIVKVLEGAKEPLHYSQIAEEVAEQGLRKNLGATPAASVNAELSTSLNSEGDDSPFERVSRGVYRLRRPEPDRREVVYIERTTDQAMGQWLKQHITDRLGGRWDWFYWFEILPVKPDGSPADGPSEKFNIENRIATMEALLIEGLEPPQDRKKGDGFSSVESIQVVDPEIEKRQQQALMDKLKSKL